MDDNVLVKIAAGVIIAIGVIGLIASIGLLLAFPIKWTWNATMPHLFALPTITWGKAWCLNFLCGCLIQSRPSTNSSKE